MVRSQHFPVELGDVEQFADPRPGAGAVQALAALFDAHRPDRWLVAPCDMPFLEASLYARLLREIGEHPVACYRSERGVEPLVAVVSGAGAGRFAAAARRDPDRSLRELWRELGAAEIPVPAGSCGLFLNVNSREDLDAMKRNHGRSDSSPGRRL